MSDMYKHTKPAWVWVYAIHPYCVGYPGVIGDLFFSSPEAFRAALERDPGPEDILVPCTVPVGFDDWDYIPRDY